MRLLVVGGGGREHALCWSLRQENPGNMIYCAPGNPGTAQVATNLPIAADDIDRIADAADMYGIDLVIIGPEGPLALGLADRLRAEGRLVAGPSAAAARIEASKAFSKDVMAAAGIPTAASQTFTDLAAALAYVQAHTEPLVVKASGLAAGKGAIVCETRAEAAAAVQSMLGDGQFGDAGRVVVIEDFLEGEEVSLLALTDGNSVTILPAAQDHKRLLEQDRGTQHRRHGCLRSRFDRDEGTAGERGDGGIPALPRRTRPSRRTIRRRAVCRAHGGAGRHAQRGRVQLSAG